MLEIRTCTLAEDHMHLHWEACAMLLLSRNTGMPGLVCSW